MSADDIATIQLTHPDNTENMDYVKEQSHNEQDVVNSWTEQNTRIVRTWKENLHRTAFIFRFVSGIYKGRLNRIMMAIIIINAFATIFNGLSTISLTTDNIIYKYIALSLNAMTFIMAGLSTVLPAIAKMQKYDEYLSSLAAYSEKIDAKYSQYAAMLMLPAKMRKYAYDYIKSENEHFVDLIKQNPEVDNIYQKKALVEYNYYLKEHPIDDMVIEIIN